MSKKAIQLTDSNGNDILPVSAESGNGYIKFADGTLVTYGEVHITGLTSVGVFFGDAATYASTFAFNNGQTFISIPKLLVSNIQDLRLVCIGGDIGLAAATAYSFNRNADGIMYFDYIAIGRWK